jgi:hypothetical protein
MTTDIARDATDYFSTPRLRVRPFAATDVCVRHRRRRTRIHPIDHHIW